jgi:hypothetical protein
MRGAVLERCVEKSPLSVMVRAALERVLGAERLARWEERSAQPPETRDLRCSSVYARMNPGVCGGHPSGRAAAHAPHNAVGTALVAVYNTLNGLETSSVKV